MTGLGRPAVRDALKELSDRGLIMFGALVPSKTTVHERALEQFQIVDPEHAKKNGYKPVTYSYHEHERHLLNALLVQNFGQPVVVVQYDLKDGPVMELWRHKDSLARYNQAKAVSLGCSIKGGKMA